MADWGAGGRTSLRPFPASPLTPLPMIHASRCLRLVRQTQLVSLEFLSKKLSHKLAERRVAHLRGQAASARPIGLDSCLSKLHPAFKVTPIGYECFHQIQDLPTFLGGVWTSSKQLVSGAGHIHKCFDRVPQVVRTGKPRSP